ncbi:MAG: hypothetical protein COX48_04970 [bacterium (Candidatus Stahlbacteria) CG23_combo_of_CG06-09_8_20_14_all_34_7]|nr:MAG: hypothetical protein COX48_04970 [bacterium (Candidatus Stahlbacteria) CG23_combo_of_CG06-09_8_20_14_all_34_7]
MKRIEETSFILFKVIEEIKKMLPSRIESIYLSKNRVLNIKTENFNLKANSENNNLLFFISSKLEEKTKHNFNDALNVYAKGLRIIEIEQIGNDRIVRMILTKERSLIIEIIPNRFNVLILEKNLIRNLYSYKKNKDGEVITNIGDEYPEKEERKSFFGNLSMKEKKLSEDFHFDEIQIKNSKIFYLYKDDKRYHILFCKTKALEPIEISPSPSVLIESAFEELKNEDKKKNEKLKLHSIELKIENLRRKLSELNDNLILDKKADEIKERAETLKANFYRADKEREFASVYDKTKKVKYVVPRGISISEYMKVLFDEYKNLKKSALKNSEIKKKIKFEIEKLEKNLLEEQNIELRDEEKEERRIGRIYISPNGFKIISGRNATENDELTMKVAKKDDIFFHAREARGSHVILKTAGKIPAKEDILYAASIAAYHSAGKHSKLVSVSYIEKRFVVKRKNSPKGEVTMLKEKTLFVRPLSARK